ncbi:hypothetical protein [Nocardioides currus]|uniref:Uncharacterized protein n=1 Tax=Nocardioides currus TaxID=2133958 RepID=A0A2R7Z075_9ACTN|nr:hypothetical protein [Nocardioides currus]PUA82023.1 hypothetical protein C7S10_08285 [Nocardioides currus]
MASSTWTRARVHAPPAYLEPVTSVLALAGLRPSPTADVALLVVDHDDPSVADAWSVESLAHLVVRVSTTSVRVGPFVQPGLTACLRCLAAAGGTPVAPRPASYAAVDRGLLVAGLGWAVRDLATWHAGGTPATWSATATIDADLAPRTTHWPRHVHCGCSWGLGLTRALGAG